MSNITFILFVVAPYLVLIAIYVKISRNIGDLDRWEKVNGVIVKQELKGPEGEYWYNTYAFVFRNIEYTIQGIMGSNPKSGKIGEKRKLLFNGDNSILPDNWIVRNYRTIGYSILIFYWPFWGLIYFQHFYRTN